MLLFCDFFLDLRQVRAYAAVGMSFSWKLAVTVLIIAAVLIIFYAPTVDLQPTTFRAVKAISAMLLAMAAVRKAVASLHVLIPSAFQPVPLALKPGSNPFYIRLLASHCARLC
jgi:predicted membrane metal-binding protein